MGRIPRPALLAADSPRISASHHRCGSGGFTANLARTRASAGFSTRYPEDFGLDGFWQVLPWRLIRTIRPARDFYLGFWTAALAHIPVLLFLPASLWAAPTVALGLLIWAELCSPRRRARRILLGVEAGLADAAGL